MFNHASKTEAALRTRGLYTYIIEYIMCVLKFAKVTCASKREEALRTRCRARQTRRGVQATANSNYSLN